MDCLGSKRRKSLDNSIKPRYTLPSNFLSGQQYGGLFPEVTRAVNRC